MSKNQTSRWFHLPSLPIQLSPIMDWPPRPIAWAKWLSRYWLVVGAVSIEFLLAWAVFTWLLPDAGTMKTLSVDWVIQLWLRNALLITAVAGSLHLWFYSFSAQGKKLKFDTREFARDSGIYTFRNQVRDNIFWTIASGVTFWTMFEALYWWASANGYAPGLIFIENPIWFAVWFVLIPVWSSFHFYWIHRLLHWPPLYKIAHALHHRNVNIGPWSGISMHPLEHMIYFTSLLIHFVIPSHPTHIIFHFFIQTLNPTFTHSGYEGMVIANKKRIPTGDFFHQLHHRYFECNYGTIEMPWDRVFGSFHDGTREAEKAVEERSDIT